jgi:hypothetical protein
MAALSAQTIASSQPFQNDLDWTLSSVGAWVEETQVGSSASPPPVSTNALLYCNVGSIQSETPQPDETANPDVPQVCTRTNVEHERGGYCNYPLALYLQCRADQTVAWLNGLMNPNTSPPIPMRLDDNCSHPTATSTCTRTNQEGMVELTALEQCI